MEVLKDYPKEFSELFQLSFNHLSKINMKQNSKNEGFLRSNWRFLYIVPCYLLHCVTMGSNIAKLAANGQIIEIAYLLPPFIFSTQGILKAIFIIPKTSLIITIMKELGDLWKNPGLNGLNETQSNKKNAILKKISLNNKVSFWVSLISIVQYLTTPLLETFVRRIIMKQDCELKLVVECSYPFDPAGNGIVFGAVYFFQCCSLYLCLCPYIGVELIMITLCGLLSIEFTLLCEDILQVKPEFKKGTKTNQKFKANDGMFTIKDVVKRHQKLCALTTLLDKAFNQIAFIDILVSGISACFCICAAQFSEGKLYIVIYYTSVATIFLTIWCLCYFGEALTEASSSIGDMAYHNLWYNGHKQYQKIINFIIIRSQKQCCLTSMRYLPINLNLFTKVLSSTWSYFSLMSYIYDDKE